MRRRLASVALVVALALACAGRAEARGSLSGGAPALGIDDDQAALAPGTHRDQRLSRPVERRAPRSPHGPAPAFLLATPAGPAGPSLVVLGRALAAPGSGCPGAAGSPRTSRGPPRPPAARL